MLSDLDMYYNQVLKRFLEFKSVNLLTNTRELTNVLFENIDPYKNVIGARNMSIKYALAELIWYFSGSNSMTWIGRYASIWKHISDDGKTSNSAYGYIMQEKFNFDQIQQVINILKEDPNSRRALINLNTPHVNKLHTKDEPCTIAIQFYIRNDKLHATTMMRSNDVWFGTPYDIFFFTELQKLIAFKLNIEAGSYNHFVTSMHMYERDLKKLERTYKRFPDADPKFSIDVVQLAKMAKILYSIVTPENIIDICKKHQILKIKKGV